MLKQDNADAGRGDQGGGGGSQIAQIMPKLYRSGDPNGGFPAAFNSVKWIVLIALGHPGPGLRAALPRVARRETHREP